MSVDITTTRKTWNDVPDPLKIKLGTLIAEIQEELLTHFNVVDSLDSVDDTNDNGIFPDLDLEVHCIEDPEASSRRLIVTTSYGMESDDE
jgi:hypothetical protein